MFLSKVNFFSHVTLVKNFNLHILTDISFIAQFNQISIETLQMILFVL